VTFGSSNYGDLGAAAAAIILDRESTSETLDADPTGVSLREVSHHPINYRVYMFAYSRVDTNSSMFWSRLTNAATHCFHESARVHPSE
jgi:hypothetical protein